MNLKVENPSVSYGAINAVKNISFEERDGEIVTLIDFNGSGQALPQGTRRQRCRSDRKMTWLGADVTMCGKLGYDANGREMLEVCKEAGICTDCVCYDNEATSGRAVIILEERPETSAANRIMGIPGANMSLATEDVAFLQNTIGQCDLVVLLLEIPMTFNIAVAAYAHTKGVPVMLNCAPSAALPDELLLYLTYISPNEREPQDITGFPIARSGGEVDMQVVKAAAALQAKGVQQVLMTLGSAGAVLANGATYYHSKAVDGIHVVDPAAADDSFIGAFCVAISGGLTERVALCFANHTAALTVSKMGAMLSLPTLQAVRKTLPENFEVL